jgi:bifunctional non-homologous end joining protein LigD
MRPSFIEPMLPTLVEDAPEGDDWIHEIKHDGYRSQLVVDAGQVRALTPRGSDWIAKIRAGMAAVVTTICDRQYFLQL